MKRLYQYIQEIRPHQFDNLFDKDDQEYMDYIYQGIENLKRVNPEISKNIILCYEFTNVDYDFDENDNFIKSYTKDYTVDYYNEKDLWRMRVERTINPSDLESYSIEMFVDWKEILGSFVYLHGEDTSKSLLKILQNIFFLSNEYQELQQKNEELNIKLFEREKQATQEIHKATSLENFLEDLLNDDEETLNEAKKQMILCQKHRENIRETIKEMNDINNKVKTAIFQDLMNSYELQIEKETEEFNKKLSDKLPFLHLSDPGIIIELCEVPYGWEKLTILLLMDIRKILDSHNVPLTDFHILQIKEKYGRLTFHYYLNEHSETCKAIQEKIKNYSEISTHICMICGTPHVHFLSKTATVGPLCEKCYYSIGYHKPYKDMYSPGDVLEIPEEGEAARILNGLNRPLDI